MFLRAINTYAVTMNQKFLNNDDFEVQVDTFYAFILIYCIYFCFSFLNSWFCFEHELDFTSLLLSPAVEQLLPLGGGVYYPGVFAAAALLANQEEQDSGQVREQPYQFPVYHLCSDCSNLITVPIKI